MNEMNCILSNADLKVFILTLSLVISNGITLFLYKRSKLWSQKGVFGERLFKIQDISLNNPHLEDPTFIKGWLDFKNSYSHASFDSLDRKNKQYLQYEQYCEMLFNFAADVFRFSNKKKINEDINFKAWIRMHRLWWKNPLDDHSNHDSYSSKFSRLMDDWVK